MKKLDFQKVILGIILGAHLERNLMEDVVVVIYNYDTITIDMIYKL